MCTIVMSNKGQAGIQLSEDARKRLVEHLKSAGIDIERLPKLIWPDDAVSAYQKHMYAPWEFTTKSDILKAKREQMEKCLRAKREYGVVKKVPLYVWVFWCPGISGIFRGWWLGIKNRDINECRHLGHNLIKRILELFPLTESTLFDEPDMEKWKKEFVKRYRRGSWCGKPQGKAPVWAEICGTRIIRILCKAEK